MAKIIGNTTTTPMAMPDWNQTDPKKADFIKNKPTVLTEDNVINLIETYGGDEQVQADFNQTDETQPDFIKNKPPAGKIFTAKIDDSTLVLTHNDTICEKGDKGDPGYVNIVQTTGDSETEAMSQAAVTAQLQETENAMNKGFVAIGEYFANSLTGNKSGEAVAITDVSPIVHNMDVRVRSKNEANIYGFSTKDIIDPNATRYLSNEYGTTISTTDPANTVTITQSQVPNTTNPISYNNGYVNIGFYNDFQEDEKITVSFDLDIIENPLGTTSMAIGRNNTNTVKFDFIEGRNEVTLNWKINAGRQYLELRNAGCSCVISNIQVERGTEATPYTPFVDVSKVKLISSGKNLLNLTSIIGKTVSANGGTIICNEDGSISGSGTPTTSVNFAAIRLELPKGKYTLSATGEFSNLACSIYFRDKDGVQIGSLGVTDTVKSKTFDTNNYPNYSYCTFEVKRSNNNVEMSGTAYFKLELGATATEDEPYVAPTEYPVNKDGTVTGVASISPTTTLLTDTAGTIIDAEYNRDINKAFAELQQAILSLGGNV